ncbi:2-oxo acid dehydrogenase subunit E2 [Cohaesibacter sp. CAU 1516]|uniref:dihydrolipoamide acetyltransferase family protein n=1 Tax=Cohaesibacter sp. CAU 1516 TaxID=2576038 RepID=UPI0010FE6160|nr:dihydrolipoamide acetyltransferase family protein [Cohaesibacter sp. CAU 1516]TLP48191.1 2-oxo acid dehydrogenase subunit E2 [Cohaesibacter sp. CAU 1516]
MGRYSIKMPDVGEGITEAEIVEWNVSVGDFVQEDDILAAVMTDKATVEIPSPVTGTILALHGELGETTAVGAEIIALEVDGDGEEHADDKAEDLSDAASDVAQDVSQVASKDETPDVQPEVAAVAPTFQALAPTGLPRPVGEKPLASPSVRRRAMDAGVRLAFVQGTGPAGRILHEDLDAYIAGGVRLPVQVSEAAVPLKNGVEEWRVIGLRRKIAERMQDSKSRIPHITYVEEIDVTDLEKLRRHMNETRKSDQPKLTILPFLMRAMVVAAREVPKISSHYDDEQNLVRQYEAVHIGMATQTDGGLMVPVVRHAEARGVRDMADEIRRLADAARDGSITRDELTGSTITISSLGAMGGIVSTPVINSPEVAIIGVNKVVIRPIYIDGEFQPRQIMNLSSSFDHRIIDGWDAAVFIQKIKSLLEHPALLFVE